MTSPYDYVRCKSEKDASYKQVLTLEKKCFTKADSWRGDIAQELHKRNTFIVCMVDRESHHVIAYMLYSVHSMAAHIARLAVCPQHRRAGHATRLVSHVTRDLLSSRRIGTFTLHVAAANTPAMGLYKGVGFQEDAFLQDYYSEGRHAYRMVLELGDT